MAEIPALDVTPAHAAGSEPVIPTSAVIATVLGNALEFYDFTTYAFFAVMIGRAFFPAQDPFISLLLSVAAFGVGFITRPLGGIVIGAYADRAGRKPAMMLSISLMATGMVLLAATPSYAAIGLAAPILVVVARLVQGFALGGEVGPSTSYLLEAAPAGRRGQYGAWQIASQGAASALAGLLGVLLSWLLDAGEMQSWGWRIPFIVGIAIVPRGTDHARPIAGDRRPRREDDPFDRRARARDSAQASRPSTRARPDAHHQRYDRHLYRRLHDDLRA